MVAARANRRRNDSRPSRAADWGSSKRNNFWVARRVKSATCKRNDKSRIGWSLHPEEKTGDRRFSRSRLSCPSLLTRRIRPPPARRSSSASRSGRRGRSRRRLRRRRLSPFDILRSSSVPHVTYDPRRSAQRFGARRVPLCDHHGPASASSPFHRSRRGWARPSCARNRCRSSCDRPARGATFPPSWRARAIDTSLEVNFQALALPETVFVGQQANYEVAVFLNETVRDRLRRNPTFFPPDMQSMLAYDLADARRYAAAAGRVALLRRARLPARAVSAHAGALRHSAGAARLLAAAVGELLQPRGDPRAANRQFRHRRRRAAACRSTGRLRRRGGRPARRRAARHRDDARRRPDAAHRARERYRKRQALPATVGVDLLGDAGERRRARADRLGVAPHRRREGVRLGAHAAHRRRARPPADPLQLLQSRRAPLRGGDHGPPTRVHINPGTLASSDTARTESMLATAHAVSWRAAARRRTRSPLFWALLAAPADSRRSSLGVRERRRRIAPPARRPDERLSVARPGRRATPPMPARFVARSPTRSPNDSGCDPESFTRPGRDGARAPAARRVDASRRTTPKHSCAFSTRPRSRPVGSAAGGCGAASARALPRRGRRSVVAHRPWHPGELRARRDAGRRDRRQRDPARIRHSRNSTVAWPPISGTSS